MTMEIKSFEEIRGVLEKFKESGGVGYVITPQLLKIADQVGLVGYNQALMCWLNAGVFGAKVYEPGEVLPTAGDSTNTQILVNWDGPGLCYKNGIITVGIEQTIKNIQYLLDNAKE